MSDVMITFGSGTEDDPYLVDTIAELRAKAALGEVYIKVTKDLDCNTENYLHWQTLTTDAHIDLDMHSILNVYIDGGNRCFKGATISNGYFLNCYSDSTMPFFDFCTLNRVGVKGFLLQNARSSFFNVCKMNECNMKMTNYCKAEATTIARHMYETNEDYPIQNTLFTVKSMWNPYAFTADSYYSNAIKIFKDCRIETKFVNVNKAAGIFYSKGYQAALNTCIVIADYPKSLASTSYLWGNASFSSDNCIAVKDKLPEGMQIPKGVQFVTDEQVRDPDYLNNIEFIVAEV